MTMAGPNASSATSFDVRGARSTIVALTNAPCVVVDVTAHNIAVCTSCRTQHIRHSHRGDHRRGDDHRQQLPHQSTSSSAPTPVHDRSHATQSKRTLTHRFADINHRPNDGVDIFRIALFERLCFADKHVAHAIVQLATNEHTLNANTTTTCSQNEPPNTTRSPYATLTRLHVRAHHDAIGDLLDALVDVVDDDGSVAAHFQRHLLLA
jgi:hypothetical protein